MAYERFVQTAIDAAPLVDSYLNLPLPRRSDQSIILVDTTEQLKELYMDTGVVTGNPAIDQERAADIARHEGQHAEAWSQIGAYGIEYGVRLFRLVSDPAAINICAFMSPQYGPDRPLTRLELAAAAAYPIDPSPADVQQVIEQGFSSGIDEVAIEAIKHNRAGKQIVPVPLSYTGAAEQQVWTFASNAA